jgi:hypothetical protein
MLALVYLWLAETTQARLAAPVAHFRYTWLSLILLNPIWPYFGFADRLV